MYARIKATWQKRATYTILKQINSKGRWISGNQGCFPYPESELVLQSCKKFTTKTLPRALISKLAVNPRAVPTVSTLEAAGTPSPPLSTGETPLECCAQLWSPQDKRDVDLLEKEQQRTRKTTKALEHLTQEERPDSCDCSAWRRESSKNLMGGVKTIA